LTPERLVPAFPPISKKMPNIETSVIEMEIGDYDNTEEKPMIFSRGMKTGI
jgi:hypothetical protein